MRHSWWAIVVLGGLMGSVAYQVTNQPSFPNRPELLSDEPKPQPLDEKSDRPLIDKDEARLPNDPSSAVSEPDPLPDAQDYAPPQDAAGTGANELSESNLIKQNLSYLAYYDYSELPPDPKP